MHTWCCDAFQSTDLQQYYKIPKSHHLVSNIWMYPMQATHLTSIIRFTIVVQVSQKCHRLRNPFCKTCMAKKVHHPKKDWLLFEMNTYNFKFSSLPPSPIVASRLKLMLCQVSSGWLVLLQVQPDSCTWCLVLSTLVRQSSLWGDIFFKLIQQLAVFSRWKLWTKYALMMHVGWWVRKQIWGFMPNSYVWCCFDMIISEYISVQNKANNSMHLIDSIHGAQKLHKNIALTIWSIYPTMPFRFFGDSCNP